MENVVKKVLNEQLDNLRKDLWSKTKEIDELCNQEIKINLVKIDSMFKDWEVSLNDSEIYIKHESLSSFNGPLSIKFPYTYTKEGYKHHDPTVKWSGVEVDKDIEIDLGIMIGLLCKAKRSDSDEWKSIIYVFNEKKVKIKENVDPLWKDIYKIEEEVKKIDREEQEKSLQDKIAKGEILLEKQECIHYGSGKHDKVWSDRFVWELNKSGKTATLYSISKKQQHDGEKWITTDEDVKSKVTERLKICDLRSFLRNK